jgi:hypothetical protein
VQGADEGGGTRFGPVHVDVDGDGLADGVGDLTCGRGQLVRGLLPHPGNLPQPIGPGLKYLENG